MVRGGCSAPDGRFRSGAGPPTGRHPRSFLQPRSRCEVRGGMIVDASRAGDRNPTGRSI